MPDRPRVLVVGTAPGSLGEALVGEMIGSHWSFGEVVTADLQKVEYAYEPHYTLDVRNSARVREILNTVCPDIVLCTVGINERASIDDRYLGLTMEQAFQVNTIGVITLLHHFLASPPSGQWSGSPSKKFVAVSSNSARIARRGSLAYCASKAALSMALRVAARELARDGNVCVWGYEPGLLAGTPMTLKVEQMFGDAVTTPLHRMPGVGPRGLSVAALAAKIVGDVANAGPGYHGTLIPFDAGEQ